MAHTKKMFYDELLLIAIAVIVVTWFAYVWESTTGKRFRFNRGRRGPVTERQIETSRNFAIIVTGVAGPAALFAAFKRRSMKSRDDKAE